MSRQPLLAVNDLDFAYGPVQVLFGLTMHVEQGETLALLGTNGSGKSTLLKAIVGLQSPLRGTVTLDGEDVTGLDTRAMVDRGVVLVEGGKAVFPDLTVMENLEVGSFIIRRNGLRARCRRDAVLGMFPALAEKRARPAGTLSGGQQQQLAIAKGMLLEPRLLLIDELSLGLSPALTASLLDTVRQLAADGTTLVLVEQSLEVAAAACARAVFLEKGTFRFEGATSDLMERSDIARAVFLGSTVAAQ